MMDDNRELCNHFNLEKIETGKEQGHTLLRCSDCGHVIPKQICTLCGSMPVDDITDHMLRVHDFDISRWNAVTGLGT
jgi:rRNA maturation endonuclease Nob1